MEQRARLVQLPPPIPRIAASIACDGDHLVVEHLELLDPSLAAFVRERTPDERPSLVERALRIGLTALQDAGVSINVDVVRREFEGLLHQTETANERAASALDRALRDNFADDGGRLPRTLERFLGDRGQLRSLVTDLFDESKRDSAIGRMRQLLGTYFDGDASRLAQLLDPTRLGSPLHQFRTEVSAGFAKLNERLAAIEAAAATRAVERSRSAAKGADFEDLVEELLGIALRGSGDLVDRTSDEAGSIIRSKKGDLLVTLDTQLTRGADLRIVVECKDRAVSGRQMRDELAEARRNRAAVVGLVVFTPAHAPAGLAPFDVRQGDVYCVLDPVAPDPAVLDAALRLARLIALATLNEREVDMDPAAIASALTAIRAQLDALRALKTQLTSIGKTATDVNGGLDRLRDGILAQVTAAEQELRLAGPRTG